MEMGNEHGFSVSFHFPFPVEMGNENENSAKIPEMGNENGALTLLATQDVAKQSGVAAETPPQIGFATRETSN